MNHTDILNLVLSNACGALPPDVVKQNDGFQKFFVDVYCAHYVVEAKLINNTAPFQYEVRGIAKA